MVVGVDGDRALPVNVSIYQGEYARFLLVFDPIDFICNENDFTTSDDQIKVTMEEGADNIIRISVDETLPPGTDFEIRFRGQLFMLLNVIARPRTIDAMTISKDSGEGTSTTAFANFDMPTFSVGDEFEISVSFGDVKHGVYSGVRTNDTVMLFESLEAPEGYADKFLISLTFIGSKRAMYVRKNSESWVTGDNVMTVEVTKWIHEGVVVFPGTI